MADQTNGERRRLLGAAAMTIAAAAVRVAGVEFTQSSSRAANARARSAPEGGLRAG